MQNVFWVFGAHTILCRGWLGESFPFFKPNFKNLEKARREMGCDEVCH